MGWATQCGPRPGLVPTSHRLASYMYVIISVFRAALDLDTYPLSNLISPQCAERAEPDRGKPVLIMHIGFFACLHAISLERNRFINCFALVALKLLVSLISRLVAYSTRIVDDRQTDTQNDYRNPRCACVPRVSYAMYVYMTVCQGPFCNDYNHLTVLKPFGPI